MSISNKKTPPISKAERARNVKIMAVNQRKETTHWFWMGVKK